MSKQIYCGNCQDVLFHRIKDESVDMIYLDPPFFSNRRYELLWGDGYELKAYEEGRHRELHIVDGAKA